jgi:dTDP-4-amino-4,6-dideoxygalactose transaminase
MSEQILSLQKIPFLDLKKQYLQIKDEIRVAIDDVLDQTAYSGGPFVEKFEKNLAEYCHTKYALGVNTGTSALHLAMMALGIGAGDEVIIPANTFIATAWGVSYVNATPVFVDCDADTWNIDPSKIEEKITSKTKAIIGVHLYGQPFNVDAVAAIAKKHGIYMVEDCAQAIGAKYQEKKVGGFGEMGCFSFYPGKNLGAYGEGGGITTNNESYYKHIQSLRNHGSVERYYHDELGYNMRMDGIQGAVLDVKLKYIDNWNSRRKEIAKAYQTHIINEKLKMQAQPAWSDSIYHLFVVTTEDRDGFVKYLQANNIFPGLHYPVPCHLQKVYVNLGYKTGDMPNSEYLAEHCVSLPMFAELSNEEVDRVIEVINNY